MPKGALNKELLQEERKKSKKKRKTLINVVLENLCQYTNIQVGAEPEGQKISQGKMGALSQARP